jgi:hypothetical protein
VFINAMRNKSLLALLLSGFLLIGCETQNTNPVTPVTGGSTVTKTDAGFFYQVVAAEVLPLLEKDKAGAKEIAAQCSGYAQDRIDGTNAMRKLLNAEPLTLAESTRTECQAMQQAYLNRITPIIDQIAATFQGCQTAGVEYTLTPKSELINLRCRQ